jgi:hypothetical protein
MADERRREERECETERERGRGADVRVVELRDEPRQPSPHEQRPDRALASPQPVGEARRGERPTHHQQQGAGGVRGAAEPAPGMRACDRMGLEAEGDRQGRDDERDRCALHLRIVPPRCPRANQGTP